MIRVRAAGLRRLVLASANPDKATEILAILGEVLPGLEVVPRPAELGKIIEDGATLADNARLKASAVAVAVGEPAIADDTGLEVDALAGAPGVRSSRFAGEGASYADNVECLLEEMKGRRDRRARFRTVVVICWPDGYELSAQGSVEGMISESARGDGGFGYDPVFVPDGGGGLTFAELGSAAKNALSHRGRALRALARVLASRKP